MGRQLYLQRAGRGREPAGRAADGPRRGPGGGGAAVLPQVSVRPTMRMVMMMSERKGTDQEQDAVERRRHAGCVDGGRSV